MSTIQGNNPWFDYVQVVITELQNDLSGKHQNDATVDDKFEKGRFYVEEPLDYIFEPDHNPPKEEPEEKRKKEESNNEMNVIDNENQFMHARVVKESNDEGYIEYEYKSYTYKRNLYSNLTGASTLDHHYHLLNDYDAESHLSAAVRSVSMCKWPGVGFGFEVAVQQFGPEIIYFVCDVMLDSPADLGLRLGDILIEIDERNTRKEFPGGVQEINEYLKSKDSIHLLVIHESKYHMVKSNCDFFGKPHHVNCEDFVIVSHSR